VIVIGKGNKTISLVNYFHKNGHVGWRPVAIIGDQRETRKFDNQRIPFYQAQSTSQLSGYIDHFKTDTLIIVQSEVTQQWIDSVTQPTHRHIRKIIVIAGFDGVNNINVKAHDIAGTLGLEIQQNILGRWGRFIKRVMDVFLVLFGGLIAVPFMSLIALLIKIDSRGRIFYSQSRVGHYGKPIRVWKFRTMVENADQILYDYLKENPGLQAEWDKTHKLKGDPRITRVGNILRKLSLDELPQIWNILRGDMSLVGPRPIVTDEIHHYREKFELYKYVLPGMTGLWQVSGRNNTTYEQRVNMDSYYVQNWSIWLDIYILIKTVWVVISRDGAY
jgi:Undecaprenyl-phosphate galactose phosphotransferase WbaP